MPITDQFDPPLQLSEDQLDELIDAARVPAVMLARTLTPKDQGSPGCWFGGAPTLPDHLDWPVFHHAASGRDIPMHFLMQLDLAQIPQAQHGLNLAAQGSLFVFFEPVTAAFDTGYPLKSDKGIKILYEPQSCTHLPQRAAPPMPDISDLDMIADVTSADWSDPASAGLSPEYPKWPIRIFEINTYPPADTFLPPEYRSVLEELWEEEEDFLAEQFDCARDDLTTRLPKHLHSLFGASQKKSEPRFAAHGLGKTANYDLLFSLSPDPHLAHGFAEGYGIGIWIPTADIARMDFNRIVLFEDAYAP